MPARLGSAIQARQGVRRFLRDELAKELNELTEWGDLTTYPGSLLNYLPGIHAVAAVVFGGGAEVPTVEYSWTRTVWG
jgi:hypothetical protein